MDKKLNETNFWQGKSIVVTGGDGFLGRVLVRKLHDLGGVNVHVPRIDRYDLTEKGHISRMFDDMQPDMVIHLAAVCGGIGANLSKPGEFFYKNLIMGIQLFEEGRKRNLKKLVSLGTICAYPKFSPVPFVEEKLWDGYPEETNAPYGMAKKMLLVQSQAYRAQYGFNSIYLLPVNLYGPGDNFDLESSHVIPALIRKFVEAKKRGEKSVVCWGTGKVSREFLFVEDAAEGILLAAEHYNASNPVNLGSNMEIAINDLVEKIKKLVGFEGEIVWDTSKPDGQPRRKLDTKKAENLFGFIAKTDFDEGLKKTISWYENNPSQNETVCSYCP